MSVRLTYTLFPPFYLLMVPFIVQIQVQVESAGSTHKTTKHQCHGKAHGGEGGQ